MHHFLDRSLKSPFLRFMFFLVCFLLFALSIFERAYPNWHGRGVSLVDFHTFYIAGLAFWAGDLNQAYQLQSFLKLQEVLMGSKSFMPWTYPPPFDLLCAALAVFPIWLAYALFIGTSFWLYVKALSLLTDRYSTFVLYVMAPSIFIAIRCGQNGFLTASLIGLSAYYLVQRRNAAGWFLGVLAIKPHLMSGLLLTSVLFRRGRMLVGVSVWILLLALICTWVLGAEVWAAFAQGAKEALYYLGKGYYPLYRMVSVYATLRTAGLPAEWAFLGQSVVGALAIVSVLYLWIRGYGIRVIAALALIAGFFVSPYLYDYDLPILGISFALLGGGFLRSLSAGSLGLTVALAWLSAGSGMLTVFGMQLRYGVFNTQLDDTTGFVSPGSLFLMGIFILIYRHVLKSGSVDVFSANDRSKVAPRSFD